MPDFERIFDKLKVDLARTPQEKQYEIGFIAGKKRARIEVLAVAIGLYFAIAAIGHIWGS